MGVSLRLGLPIPMGYMPELTLGGVNGPEEMSCAAPGILARRELFRIAVR